MELNFRIKNLAEGPEENQSSIAMTNKQQFQKG